jgi:hypothetical protein
MATSRKAVGTTIPAMYARRYGWFIWFSPAHK